jgi:UDP-3-O-[3-hydroxymyristoyl] glucosamine N-acyltransferase
LDDGEPIDAGVRLAPPRSIDALVAEYGGVPDAGLEPVEVARVVSPEHAAHPTDLVLVTSAAGATRAAWGPGVLLCHRDVASRCPAGKRWVHPHAMWVVSRLLSIVEGGAFAQGGAGREATPQVHRAAFVEPGASVHPSASVRPGAILLDGARVGAGSVIGEGAVIYGRVVIGARVVVGALAVIGRPGFGFTGAPDGTLVRVPQLGGVVIEDDVEVGPHSTVDAGTLSPTIVRRFAKLDAHVHVAHNVVVGEGAMIAAQSGFAGSVKIGANARIGGQVGVTDHAVIGAGARIAAKSGVIGDVAEGAVVAGYPAVPRGKWLRAWATVLSGKKRSSR